MQKNLTLFVHYEGLSQRRRTQVFDKTVSFHIAYYGEHPLRLLVRPLLHHCDSDTNQRWLIFYRGVPHSPARRLNFIEGYRLFCDESFRKELVVDVVKLEEVVIRNF